MLVQVVKEPIGTKGARITSHVTIPGRFLVFMPTVDHIGVSRKIESREERARLRGIVRQFREAHAFNGGVIIRTAAANRPDADILGDLEYFHQVWKEIKHKSETQRAPAVIYREQSLVAKLLRDLLTDEFSVIRIDSAEEHRRVTALVERIMPAMLPRVKLYTRDYPIFEEYGVRTEIDKALRSKVWLKSGGYIVINQTEALVAIDVNTGRYVGKKTTGRLEDTILKTNLEAVKEIVRQLRLRDMGGIVVLDFIDMEDKKNRQKVFQTLEQELRRDRAPSKAIQVSDFGLIIITRKRVKQSLERLMTDTCPYCSGTGTIKSSATVCQEILNEMRKVGNDLDGTRRAAARQSRDRRGAAGRRARRASRGGAGGRTQGHRASGRLPAPRAVRRHELCRSVGLGLGPAAFDDGRYAQRRGWDSRPSPSNGDCMHKVRTLLVVAAVASLGLRPFGPAGPASRPAATGNPGHHPGPARRLRRPADPADARGGPGGARSRSGHLGA